MSSSNKNHSSSLRAAELFNNYSIFDKIILVNSTFNVVDKEALDTLFVEVVKIIGKKLGRYEVFKKDDVTGEIIQYLGTVDSHLFLPYSWCWNCGDYEPWHLNRHSCDPSEFNMYNLQELFHIPSETIFVERKNDIQPYSFAPLCPYWWNINPAGLCHRGLDCDYCECPLCEDEEICPIHCSFPTSLWMPMPMKIPTTQSMYDKTSFTLDCNKGTVMFLDSVVQLSDYESISDASLEDMCGVDYEPILRSGFNVIPGSLGNLFKTLLPKSKYRLAQYGSDIILLCKDHKHDRYVALVCGIFKYPVVFVTDWEADYSHSDFYMPAGMTNRYIFRHARVRYNNLEIVDRTYSSLNIIHHQVKSRSTIVRFRNKPYKVDWEVPDWNIEGIGKKMHVERCYKCGHIYLGKCNTCSSRQLLTAQDYVKLRKKKRAIDSISETEHYLHPSLLKRKSFKDGIRQDSYFDIKFNDKEYSKPRFAGPVVQLGPKKESQILANLRFFTKEKEKLLPAGTILTPNLHNFNVVKRKEKPPTIKHSVARILAPKVDKAVPVNTPYVSTEQLQINAFFDAIDQRRVMPTTQGAAATTFQRPFEDVATAARDFSGLIRDIKDRVRGFSIHQTTRFVNNVLGKMNIQQVTARALGLMVSFTRHGIEWNSIMFFFVDLAFDISNAIELVHLEGKHEGHKEILRCILASQASNEEKLERIRNRVQSLGSIFSSLFGILSGLSAKSMTYLRNFNTLCSAWRNGAPISRALISLLPKCILEFFGLLSDNLLFTNEDYEKFVRDFAAVDAKFAADPKSIRDIARGDLVKLTEIAMEFRKQAAMCVTRGPVYTFTHMAAVRLQTIISLYDDIDQLAFQRYNPMAILLHGEPGVGKSEVAKKIAAHYSQWAKGELREDPVFLKMAKDGVYSYQSQLDYMDGYQQQGVVIVDELGAQSDGTDLLPFFSLVSNNTYVCPMASLDNNVIGKKGTTFTSHTIIACSNTSSFGHLTNSYIAPEAIDRRFLAKIYVSRVGPNANDFSHLRFRINDQFNKGVEYTLPQLLYILKEHPIYGFDAYFRGQAKIDHKIVQLEKVAMPQSLATSLMTTIQLVTSILATSFGIGLYSISSNALGAVFSMVLSAVGIIGLITAAVTDVEITKLEMENERLMYYLDLFQRSKNPMISEAATIIRAETQSKAKREFSQRRTARVVFTQGSHRHAQTCIETLNKCVRDLKAEGVFSPDLEELFNQLIADAERYKSEDQLVQPIRLDPSDPELFGEKRKVFTQGLRDKVAESIENKIASTLCVIYYTRNGVLVDRVNTIPLGHVHFLLPQHFFEHYEPGDIFTINWKGADLTYTCSYDEFIVRQIAVDAAILSIPKLPFRCPALLKNFITEEELDKLIDGNISLVTIKKNNIVTIHSTYGHVLTETSTYRGQDKIYQLVRGLDYNANTDTGDCGAPIVSHNLNITGKIVGMHVAGIDFEAYGMANIITKNMITDAIKLYEQERQNPTQCVVMGAMTIYGKHEPPLYQPARTSFYRSRITDLPIEKSPVNLAVKGGVDPVLNAMMKNSYDRTGLKKFNPNILDQACEWYSGYFPRKRDTHILSLEESIQQYGKLGGLNLKTSPGYPYVLTSKKSDYIIKDPEGNYHIIDDKIINDVEELEHQAKQFPPEIVWVTCGKDECLKPGKEPRVFEIAPMSFTLMARKYFGSFIAWLHENPIVAHSAVGINPESHIWNKMYNNMTSVSSVGLAVDWKKYDSTLSPDIMMAVVELVNRWYNDEHSEIRRNIGLALITRATVYGDSWFTIHGGNPSGHFFTTPMNTLAHVLLYAHFWLENAPDELCDMYYFTKFTCLYVYGDDGVISVASPIHDWFNFEKLSQYFKEYGMVLTTDAKDGSVGSFVPIKQMTFLKRSFATDHRGMIVPQLSWTSMCTMLNWNRKSKYATPEETLQINCRVFSQFLYFFGRRDYNYWKKKLDLDIPGFDYYDKLFYGGQCFPISY